MGITYHHSMAQVIERIKIDKTLDGLWQVQKSSIDDIGQEGYQIKQIRAGLVLSVLRHPVVFGKFQELIQFEVDYSEDTLFSCLPGFLERGSGTELNRASTME